MQELITGFIDYYAAQPPTELIAVLLAVGYLVLAIRQIIWCFVCAAASTALYVYLTADAGLYMQSVLNVYYFGVAVYGWMTWRRGETDEGLPVSVWPLRVHVYALSAIALCATGVGYYLATHSEAALPYLDSATTFASLWATFLVARKVLENWLYWLVIDAASVYLYATRGLDATAVLFGFYVILVPFGLIAWTRSYRRHQAAATPS